jgi:hypothetical protein
MVIVHDLIILVIVIASAPRDHISNSNSKRSCRQLGSRGRLERGCALGPLIVRLSHHFSAAKLREYTVVCIVGETHICVCRWKNGVDDIIWHTQDSQGQILAWAVGQQSFEQVVPSSSFLLFITLQPRVE